MRMNTKAVVCAALLLVSTVSFAQLKTHKEAEEEQLGIKVADVVPDFVATTQPVLAAQASVLTALGMGAEAAKLKAASDTLTPQAPRAALDDVMELQGDSAEAIADKVDGKPQLDAANAKLFADGVRDLAVGYTNYAEMSRKLEPLRKRWRGGGITTGALFVAKGIPFSVKKLGNSLKAAAAYAKASNIALAPEVDAAVATL